MTLDVTVATGPLAAAAAGLSRLLPGRSPHPAHACVLLRADHGRLQLVAGDGEVGVRADAPAVGHEPGEVVVSRRVFTDTVASLDAPEVRLVAEGTRLAVRVPGARFALPCVEGIGPPPARLPAAVGSVAGADLLAGAVPVAAAASREHSLPIFTGVRVRSQDGRLSLLATDRFRLAWAIMPWEPTADADVLVPAWVLGEAARQVGRSGTVTLHADGDLFGLSWEGGSAVTSTLGSPFPDAQLDRLLDMTPECTAEVDADALSGAVHRASRYGGEHGRVAVQVTDGALLVRASDQLSGESEETVKAAVRGDHVARSYQARFLVDALRPFAGHTVVMRIQAGLRPTGFTAAPSPVELHYLVVPMRTD